MRIIVVLESWGTGGTEQYVKMLYQAAIETGKLSPVHLVLLKNRSETEPLTDENWVQQVTCPKDSEPAGVKVLQRAIRESTADICHLHLYTSTLPAAMTTRRFSNHPLVATFHSPVSAWSFRHRCGFRLAVGLCDTVIGGSEFTAEQLKRWSRNSVAAPPAVTIDNWLRDKIASSSVAEPRQPTFRIVGCGRLSKEKDWCVLISALARLKANLSTSIECALIGSGSMHQALVQQVHREGLQQRVEFVGSLPHDQALTRVAEADLFVLPSRFEGFGMAAVEAMSLGVPTVTANFAASHEYLKHGETGQHFPIGDADALAHLIQWHIDHREQSQAMGRTGMRSVVDRYSANRLADQHVRIYESLLDTRVATRAKQPLRTSPHE